MGPFGGPDSGFGRWLSGFRIWAHFNAIKVIEGIVFESFYGFLEGLLEGRASFGIQAMCLHKKDRCGELRV